MQDPENPSRPARRRARRRPPQQPPKQTGNAGNVRYLPGSNGSANPSDYSSGDPRSKRPVRPALPPAPANRSQPTRVRRTTPEARSNPSNSNARFNLRSLLSSDTPAPRRDAPRKDTTLRLPNPNSRSGELNRGAIARVSPNSQQLAKMAPAAAPLVARPNSRVAPVPLPAPRRIRKLKRPPTPPSPLLYATRLLILGIGVGAIAGTVLSVWNPKSKVSSAISATPPSFEAGMTNNNNGFLFGRDNTPVQNNPIPLSVRLGQQIPSLTTALQSLVATAPDMTVGVYLVDMDTGNFVNVNGDARLQAASTIKVPVLVSFFQDLDAGKIRLDQKLTMEQIDVATESGEMQYQPIGTQFSALEVATKMITISDNTATNILIRQGGGIPAMNQRFRNWGLSNTGIANLLPDLSGTNTVSAKDLSLLLASVSQGNLLSVRSRDRLLDIMRGTVTNTLIPAGIGPENNALVAHKTGTIGTMVGDTGIVDMTSGKRYVLTVIVQRPAGDDRAQELIRQISREVYRYFDTQQRTLSQTVNPETSPAAVPASSAAPASDMAPAAAPDVAPTP